MTREEAQDLYDRHGTEHFAALWGVARFDAYCRLREMGVRFRPRGGWTEKHSQHRSRWAGIKRIPCRYGQRDASGALRLCVFDEDFDGCCGMCRRAMEAVAGIRSTLDVEACVR